MRVSVKAVSIISASLLVGIGGGIVWNRSGADRAIPRSDSHFEQASWMPKEAASVYGRLVNDLVHKPVWTDDDARLAIAAMTIERPEAPPAGFESVVPPTAATPRAEVDRFLAHPGSDKFLEWHFRDAARVIVWGVLKDRMHERKPVPDEVELLATERWLEELASDDQYARIRGANSLILTYIVEHNEDARMKVEAVRLGDPSANVRQAVDRTYQHLVRLRGESALDARTSDCNTCP